jgi:hypothetical protein
LSQDFFPKSLHIICIIKFSSENVEILHQVYIAEVEESVETCVKRNIHHRTQDEIKKIQRNWQSTPSNYVRLDVRTLLQDEAVQDVRK